MRSGTGALLALLAWLVPDAATAGCSTTHLPTSSLSPGSMLGLDSPGANPAPAPVAPKSCTGPSCSGRPAMPMSQAPAPIHRATLRAILEVAAADTPPGSAESGRDDARVSPIRSASAIFHPPRLAPPHLPR